MNIGPNIGDILPYGRHQIDNGAFVLRQPLTYGSTWFRLFQYLFIFIPYDHEMNIWIWTSLPFFYFNLIFNFPFYTQLLTYLFSIRRVMKDSYIFCIDMMWDFLSVQKHAAVTKNSTTIRPKRNCIESKLSDDSLLVIAFDMERRMTLFLVFRQYFTN